MVQAVEPIPQQILAEATRLFARHGFAGTSIQAIAAGVGISKPTLVYHYGSKERLYDAVLDALLDHWRDELPRLMTAASSGGPRLDALLSAFFDFFRRDPNRARLLLREALDRPDALRLRLREHLQPWTGLLTQALRVGQAQGVLREQADPEAFTVLVISAALGVVALGEHTAALVSPEPDLDAQQAELVRIARSSLLSPPGA